MNVAYLVEKNKDYRFETLNLFRNGYSMRVYHGFLGYAADKENERLVEATILFLGRLNAWIVNVSQRLDCDCSAMLCRARNQRRTSLITIRRHY